MKYILRLVGYILITTPIFYICDEIGFNTISTLLSTTSILTGIIIVSHVDSRGKNE